jgi:hypothetical protein
MFEELLRKSGVNCSSIGTGSWGVNPGRDEGSHQCWWSSTAVSERCAKTPLFYRRFCPCKRKADEEASPNASALPFEEIPSLLATASSEESGREAAHAADGVGLDSRGRSATSRFEARRRLPGVWNTASGANSSSWFQLDLGNDTALAALKIWNYRHEHHNSSASFRERCHGLRNFSVQAYVNSSWITLVKDVALGRAGEDGAEEPYDGHAYKAVKSALPPPYDRGTSEIVEWLPVTTRLLRLTDLTHYGAAGNGSCYGLSEVKAFRQQARLLHAPKDPEVFAARASTTQDHEQEPIETTTEPPLEKESPGNGTDDSKEPVVLLDDPKDDKVEAPSSSVAPHSSGSSDLGRPSGGDRRAVAADAMGDGAVHGWKARFRETGPPVSNGEAMRSMSLVLFGVVCMTVAVGALRHQLWDLPKAGTVPFPDSAEADEDGVPEQSAVREEYYNLAAEAEKKVDAEDVLSEPESLAPRCRTVMGCGGGLRSTFFGRKSHSNSMRSPRGFTKTTK